MNPESQEPVNLEQNSSPLMSTDTEGNQVDPLFQRQTSTESSDSGGRSAYQHSYYVERKIDRALTNCISDSQVEDVVKVLEINRVSVRKTFLDSADFF